MLAEAVLSPVSELVADGTGHQINDEPEAAARRFSQDESEEKRFEIGEERGPEVTENDNLDEPGDEGGEPDVAGHEPGATPASATHAKRTTYRALEQDNADET